LTTSFQAPSLGTFCTCVTVIPLRCGSLALPPISLVWERSGNPSVKVLETANHEVGPGGLHIVYVHPLAIVQSPQ
jgi:hypothetical protein